MSKKRLLLLSNSTNHGQTYLEHGLSPIKDFLGDGVKKVLFVPYAGVTFSFDDYTKKVRERYNEMGYEMESVHTMSDPVGAANEAEAIAVGGGNTFRLLHDMYETGLVEAIRRRALEGIPYMGWSAGSNMACPTIKTTNDMPIIEPPSFDALGLIKFQINPHYLDAHPDGHQGETREQRILEFIEINPDMFVVGLRESSILQVEGDSMKLLGEKPMRIFKKGLDTKECKPGDSLDFLM